jgi:hypothetical protein
MDAFYVVVMVILLAISVWLVGGLDRLHPGEKP